MITRLLFVIILSFITLNCTHTRYIQDNNSEESLLNYKTIEERSKTEPAKIVTTKGTYSATHIRISPDSTLFIETKSGDEIELATKYLEIYFRDSGKGALEGMGIGFLVGFGIGFPLGFASYQEGGIVNLGDSRFGSGLVGGLIFAVPSTVIGLIVGASNGGEDKYILTRSAVQKTN